MIPTRYLRAWPCLRAMATLYRLRSDLELLGMSGCAEYQRLVDAVIERSAEIHDEGDKE